MGQRSSTETIVALLHAFLERRTWSQVELAERLAINVPTVRKRLQELSTHGVPLTRDDDPPQVYWSVPRDWFPGGVLFSGDEALDLVRHLLRLPAGPARDRHLRRFPTPS